MGSLMVDPTTPLGQRIVAQLVRANISYKLEPDRIVLTADTTGFIAHAIAIAFGIERVNK